MRSSYASSPKVSNIPFRKNICTWKEPSNVLTTRNVLRNINNPNQLQLKSYIIKNTTTLHCFPRLWMATKTARGKNTTPSIETVTEPPKSWKDKVSAYFAKWKEPWDPHYEIFLRAEDFARDGAVIQKYDSRAAIRILAATTTFVNAVGAILIFGTLIHDTTLYQIPIERIYFMVGNFVILGPMLFFIMRWYTRDLVVSMILEHTGENVIISSPHPILHWMFLSTTYPVSSLSVTSHGKGPFIRFKTKKDNRREFKVEPSSVYDAHIDTFNYLVQGKNPFYTSKPVPYIIRRRPISAD